MSDEALDLDKIENDYNTLAQMLLLAGPMHPMTYASGMKELAKTVPALIAELREHRAAAEVQRGASPAVETLSPEQLRETCGYCGLQRQEHGGPVPTGMAILPHAFSSSADVDTPQAVTEEQA